MKKASKWFGRILFWLVCIVSIFCVCLSFLPRAIGFTAVSVRDTSMAPGIPKGALVLTVPVEFDSIQEKDVLLFADPDSGQRFLRIVVEIWPEQQLVTAASTTSRPDPMTTTYRCVVGRAVRCIPVIGYPALWLQTVLGKVILALLYIIWIAVEIELRSASKRRETPT